MRKKETLNFVFCGLFAALTAVLSQISVPLHPVPINLATLSVFIAGGVLGVKYGAVSQIVYVLMGCVGLPVFAQFRGGIGVLAGPTGGYIAGYVAAAFVVGLLGNVLGHKPLALVVAMAAGLALCYLLGTLWFMYVQKVDLWAALTSCVIPFLIGDALKMAVASVLIPQLHKIFQKTVDGALV